MTRIKNGDSFYGWGKLNNLSISRRPRHNFKNTDTYPKNRDLSGEAVIHTHEPSWGKKVGHRDPPSYVHRSSFQPFFVFTLLFFSELKMFARSYNSTSKACGREHQPALAESLKL